MLPILLKLGPITIYAYGVFMLLGLFAGLYWFWKMGRDEHWDENWIFDTFFLATFSYFLMGRIGYVLWHPELYSLGKALSLFAYPGISTLAGVAAALGIVWLSARRTGGEVWKVLDAWSVTLAIIMVIASVGAILNGSMPGIESSRWGYVHPGDSVPRLSGDLLTFVWALVSFGVVSRVRKNFRFYSWYKGEASVARDGLAALVLFGLTGIYALAAGFILEGTRIWIIPRISLIGAVVLVLSALMIFVRSGRYKKKG